MIKKYSTPCGKRPELCPCRPGIITDRPFLAIFAGKKNSGKTHLAGKLLFSSWKNLFEEIIFISPTFHLQYKKQNSPWSKISSEGVPVYKECTTELIETFLKMGLDTKKRLIIFDDNGSNLRKTSLVSEQSLNMLVSNSRHLNISLLFLSQRLSQNLPIIRSQCDLWCIFGTSSYAEKNILYQQVSIMPRKEFEKIFSECTKDPFSFICVTTGHGGQIKYYHSDFKTLAY